MNMNKDLKLKRFHKFGTLINKLKTDDLIWNIV